MNHIFISCGDVNGIGPEIIMKSAVKMVASDNIITVIGSYQAFIDSSESVDSNLKPVIIDSVEDAKVRQLNFLEIDSDVKFKAGHITADAGKTAALAIKKGVSLAKEYNGAILTAPINKESLHLGGFKYPGHTEYIAELLGGEDHLMILDGGEIRVALVTTHLRLGDVPSKLKKESIIQKGTTLYNSLKKDYGIESPIVAVCSLNPHASDGGLFGDEEEQIITPAAEELRKVTGGNIIGPLPSDTLFTKIFLKKVDAYLVMYHDQGLIPMKLLSFGKGVNFTAGLSIVRTSPDHGTAFDIAGKGIADESSFMEAFNKAMMFLKNRKRG